MFNLFDFSYTQNGVTKQKPQWQIDMENKNRAPDLSNTLAGKAVKGTQSFLNKFPILSSEAGPKEAFGNIASSLQGAATSIKNAGYSDAQGMQEKQKSFISDMLAKGYDKETIFKAMDQLKAQGKFQGSWSENPITGTLSSIASAPLQALGTIASGGESAARAGELAQQGDVSGAAATFGKGLTQGALGGLGVATGFTPGGAAVNTAFSSETVGQPLEKYVSAPIRGFVAKGQEALGYDPNSEGSKALQETTGMVLPLALLGGTQYGVNKFTNKLTNKVSVPKEGPITKAEPTKLQKFSNARAEQLLSSQWKLDKATRTKMQNQIGETGAKFALERDLVGKDIEGTADNAGAYKLQKIQEKMDAVKQFGNTTTPEVAKNVANTLKNDIISNVKKSYGKNANISDVLTRDNPDIAKVYNLADEVANSTKTDYLKLEQLKELHDYLNPEGIQYDVTGKPVSEVGNLLASGKRSKLQTILEEAGNKNGVDIKGINKDIQGAYQLEKGLNNAASRIQNLNILGLGDTQTAVIAAILGGAPGAIGGVLLKKGLSSEGFRSGLAKKLYTKNPKNEITTSANNVVTPTSPVSRMGRIMNYSDSTATSKIKKKPLINLAEEKAKAKSNLLKNGQVNKKSTTPEVQGTSGEIPEGYIRNPFNGKIEKINQSKKGSLNIGQIGEDLGIIKKPKAISESLWIGKKVPDIKNIDTSFGKYNSGRLEHKNGSLDYEIVGNAMDIDLVKVSDKQKGTGTLLMKEAEKLAQKKGLKQIRLSSQPMDSSIGQKELNSFYEKNGYVNKGDNYFVKVLK